MAMWIVVYDLYGMWERGDGTPATEVRITTHPLQIDVEAENEEEAKNSVIQQFAYWSDAPRIDVLRVEAQPDPI